MSTEAQIAANQKNAQLSTGPTSPIGSRPKRVWTYIQAVHEDRRQHFNPAEFGFEFSLEQIEVRAMELDRHLFAEYEQELRDKRDKAA